MSRLTKASIKYYVREGAILMALVLGIGVLFLAEMAVLNLGEDNYFEYTVMSVTMMVGMFMVMFNVMKSFYGANWTDSMVLSMGARRKDVFRGEIIKSVIYNAGCTLAMILLVVVAKQYYLVTYIAIMFCVSFPAGALGQAIGFKVRKYGKAVLFAIIIVFAGCGGAVGSMTSDGDRTFSAMSVLNVNLLIVAIISAVLFVLIELWVYNLNKNCMVQC